MPSNRKAHPEFIIKKVHELVVQNNNSYGVAGKTIGLSRCAVAGICSRNGWKSGTGLGGNITKLTVPRKKKERPVMPPKPVKPSNDNAVVLWEIPKGGCHWPVDCEGEHKLFCAEPQAFPADRNRNYCPYHHSVSLPAEKVSR